MLLYTMVVAVVAILVWCLRLEVNLEKSFSIISTVPRKDLFIFLSTPVNLERSHPTIFKVSEIRSENDAVAFTVEEDLGGLIGRNKLTVRIVSYSNTSASTSFVQMDFYSSIAIVTVTVTISDHNNATPTFPEDKTVSGNLAVNHTLTGHSAASETETGNLAAGETVTRQSAASETVKGHSAASETVTGNLAASETVTRQSAASETVKGHSAASETVTGNLAATETVTYQLAASKTAEDHIDIPPVMVHVFLRVRTWRVFSPFISGHALGMWDKTIRNTVDILGGKLEFVNHSKTSVT